MSILDDLGLNGHGSGTGVKKYGYNADGFPLAVKEIDCYCKEKFRGFKVIVGAGEHIGDERRCPICRNPGRIKDWMVKT